MTRQLTEHDVRKMTPEQIDEAHRKGQLRNYLGGDEPVPPEGQLADAHVQRMTAEEIVAAEAAGRLDDYLGRQRPA